MRASMAARQRAMSIYSQVDTVYEDFQPKSEWTENAAANILTVHLPGFTRDHIWIVYDVKPPLMRVRGAQPVRDGVVSRFSKEFPIPDNCKLNEMKAKFDLNEVLTITMPKKIITPEVAQSKDTEPMEQREAPSNRPSVAAPEDDQTKPPPTKPQEGKNGSSPKSIGPPAAASVTLKEPEKKMDEKAPRSENTEPKEQKKMQQEAPSNLPSVAASEDDQTKPPPKKTQKEAPSNRPSVAAPEDDQTKPPPTKPQEGKNGSSPKSIGPTAAASVTPKEPEKKMDEKAPRSENTERKEQKKMLQEAPSNRPSVAASEDDQTKSPPKKPQEGKNGSPPKSTAPPAAASVTLKEPEKKMDEMAPRPKNTEPKGQKKTQQEAPLNRPSVAAPKDDQTKPPPKKPQEGKNGSSPKSKAPPADASVTLKEPKKKMDKKAPHPEFPEPRTQKGGGPSTADGQEGDDQFAQPSHPLEATSTPIPQKIGEEISSKTAAVLDAHKPTHEQDKAGRDQKPVDQKPEHQEKALKEKHNQPMGNEMMSQEFGRIGKEAVELAAAEKRTALGMEEDRKLLVNAGVAVLVIVAVGTYFCYKLSSSCGSQPRNN
ncbi:hypothetical protein SAY87_027734 [Trapa incisa]|uniref:SHSP domain-containing protein n=1 Tax=Trapa incisa TaxID=236973 RepID=A0AAN7JMY3_9MYRT|nr:hypothetical protein SAY87_027734 [Trapa incisa]